MSESDPENEIHHKKMKVCETTKSDGEKSINMDNSSKRAIEINGSLVVSHAMETEGIGLPAVEPRTKVTMAEKDENGAMVIGHCDHGKWLEPSALITETTTTWTTLPYNKLLERKKEEIIYGISLFVRLPQMRHNLHTWLTRTGPKGVEVGIQLFPMVESPVCKEYRNMCTFKIGVDEKTQKQIVEYCLCTEVLQKGVICSYCSNELPKNFIEIAELFQEYLENEPCSAKPFWHQLTLQSSQSGKVMATAQGRADYVLKGSIEVRKKELKRFFRAKGGSEPHVSSVYFLHFLNGKKTIELLIGDSNLKENIGEKIFWISPLSYVVPCTQSAELYFKLIEDLVQPNRTMTVLDIGCGVGAFSITIANKCKQVFGFDAAECAVNDACINAAKNGALNCQFFCKFSYGGIKAVLDCKLKDDEEVVAVVHPYCNLNDSIIQNIPSIHKVVYVGTEPYALKKIGKKFCRPPRRNRTDERPLIPVKVIPFDVYPLAVNSFIIIYFERRTRRNFPDAQVTVTAQILGNVTTVVCSETRSTHPNISKVQAVKGKYKDLRVAKLPAHVQNVHLMNNPNQTSHMHMEDEIADKLLCIMDSELTKARNIIKDKFYQLCYKLDQIDWSKILTDEVNIVADAVFTRLSLEFPAMGQGKTLKQNKSGREESLERICEREVQYLPSIESTSEMQGLIDERVKSVLAASGFTVEASKLLQSFNSEPSSSGASHASTRQFASTFEERQSLCADRHGKLSQFNENMFHEQHSSRSLCQSQFEEKLNSEKIQSFLAKIGLPPENAKFYQNSESMPSLSNSGETASSNTSVMSHKRMFRDRYNGEYSPSDRWYSSSKASQDAGFQMHAAGRMLSRDQFQESSGRNRRESSMNFNLPSSNFVPEHAHPLQDQSLTNQVSKPPVHNKNVSNYKPPNLHPPKQFSANISNCQPVSALYSNNTMGK